MKEYTVREITYVPATLAELGLSTVKRWVRSSPTDRFSSRHVHLCGKNFARALRKNHLKHCLPRTEMDLVRDPSAFPWAQGKTFLLPQYAHDSYDLVITLGQTEMTISVLDRLTCRNEQRCWPDDVTFLLCKRRD